MDILLLAITVISLVVAFIMSVAAWRLAREQRERSAARVAALTAAASEGDRVPEPVQPAVEWEAVAVNARPAAPVAPWAPARVSSFPSETPDRRTGRQPAAIDTPVEAPMGDAFLGSAVATPESGGRQRGLAVAACVLFVALVSGGYWTIYGDASNSVAAADRSSAGAAPLELVSMRHERRGPKLSITGLVRNPGTGAMVERVAAVVFLFDQHSAFVSSARADVDFTKLAPGDESPFVVTVDAPASVARYRVSFRNEAGVVPHVDRRGQEPITGSVQDARTGQSR
jgi:hypothetical protein